MKRNHNESGRTMLEMMGVLAIMGLLMYGAISAIGFGVTMYKVTAQYNDIEDIAQTVEDLYSWKGDFGADGSDIGQVLCQKGLTPLPCNTAQGGQWVLATQITEASMFVTGKDDATGVYFTIELRGLSELACGRLKAMKYANLSVDDNQDCSDAANTLILRSN